MEASNDHLPPACAVSRLKSGGRGLNNGLPALALTSVWDLRILNWKMAPGENDRESIDQKVDPVNRP